jgi:hypothetical protein
VSAALHIRFFEVGWRGSYSHREIYIALEMNHDFHRELLSIFSFFLFPRTLVDIDCQPLFLTNLGFGMILAFTDFTVQPFFAHTCSHQQILNILTPRCLLQQIDDSSPYFDV